MTEVLTLWWHGQHDPIARLPDFTVQETSLTPEAPFLLLSGRSGETHRGHTVDIVTGEVLVTVEQSLGPVRLLLAPSVPPIDLGGRWPGPRRPDVAHLVPRVEGACATLPNSVLS